jgi:hypothetical protein
LCAAQVIFPLLKELLIPRPTVRAEVLALEETRQRASALASKIFLQYPFPPSWCAVVRTSPSFTPISCRYMTNIMSSDGFEDLWMQLLEFTEQYMKADNSELLVRPLLSRSC